MHNISTLPLLISVKRHEDDRGWFSESYNEKRSQALGIRLKFIQDNLSFSISPGTIRGLHFQRPPAAQAKLIQVLRGKILDVAVDLRRDSPTFGKHISVELSSETGEQLYVPIGFAHGFLTLEPNTLVTYKVSDFYSPDHEGGVHWDDPALNIKWPIESLKITTSAKDSVLPRLDSFESPFEFDGAELQELRRAAR